MSDAAFGPLVTGSHVEAAALDTLKLWTPAYLAWAERLTGRAPGSIPQPRSWVTASDFERWPQEQLPSVMLLSTGLAGEPTKDGRHSYRAPFAIGLAVVVSATKQKDSDELAKLYTAVLRSILLHHPALGGLAEGVDWLDERYDVLPSRGKQQLAAGQGVFRAEVRNVVDGSDAPLAPPTDPYDPYPDSPLVQFAEVEVDAASEAP